MRLRRRARATTAIRLPAATGQSLDPRAQRPTRLYCANTPRRLGPGDCAARAGPAFVMWPRCRRSAELSSRGTSPIAALTWPADAKRADVIDKRPERQRHHRPHPRHALQPLHDRIRVAPCVCQPRIHARRSPSLSVVDHPPQRRDRLRQVGRQRQPRQPRAARARRCPAPADSPLCRSSARTSDNRAAPHLHQLPPAPQHLPQRALRRRHPMRRPIPAAPIGFRQRRHIAPIRFDLAPDLAIHRRVIRDRPRSPRGPPPRAPAPPTHSPSPSPATSASARARSNAATKRSARRQRPAAPADLARPRR